MQLDVFTRQINPILSGLGFYKAELNAFFSNTVAATQASEPNPNGKGLLHGVCTLHRSINLHRVLRRYSDREHENGHDRNHSHQRSA